MFKPTSLSLFSNVPGSLVKRAQALACENMRRRPNAASRQVYAHRKSSAGSFPHAEGPRGLLFGVGGSSRGRSWFRLNVFAGALGHRPCLYRPSVFGTVAPLNEKHSVNDGKAVPGLYCRRSR
ncbi:hypothetical protein DDE83_008035 [Stemphylium lycopersici]|uniref:Uncharacterized protein n=1 Tax=Stemphylium lycopersici TaxID=183478 RepID=A0A364MVC8_STELY|nr:hypothetical protein DDE83_008035 [Stemphylium lycopersici]